MFFACEDVVMKRTYTRRRRRSRRRRKKKEEGEEEEDQKSTKKDPQSEPKSVREPRIRKSAFSFPRGVPQKPWPKKRKKEQTASKHWKQHETETTCICMYVYVYQKRQWKKKKEKACRIYFVYPKILPRILEKSMFHASTCSTFSSCKASPTDLDMTQAGLRRTECYERSSAVTTTRTTSRRRR